MANRAAFHRGRHIGKPIIGRSKNSLTFDNEDGTKTTIITGVPLHKGIGPYSIFDEIDTSWQVDTGAWQYKFDTSDFLVNARDQFNVGNIFQFTDPISGEWVQFDPQSLNWIDETTSRQQIAIKQSVSAVPNDYRLQFPNAWGSGRHFQYEAHVTRLAKVITIDSAGDLPSVTLGGSQIWLEAEFSLATSSGIDIYINGQVWQKANGVRVQTSDKIEFRDSATGQQILWKLDYPVANDSNNDVIIGEMECRRQGGPSSLFITIRIPKTWIDTAIFPIFVDPTTVYSGSGDGEVGKLDGTSWSNVHDTTTGQYSDTTFSGITNHSRRKPSGPTWEIVRAFLPFDTSSIPDSDTISAATINTYAKTVYDEINDGVSYMTIVEGLQASPTALVVGDYDACGDAVTNPTEGVDSGQRKDLTSVSTSAYTVYTLNSTGLGWISKTGYSKFGIREGHDTTNTSIDTGNVRSGVVWYSSEETGTSTDPYIEVTHSSPSDDLTATGISTTPVVGQPTIGQKHALTATGISTTPVVGQPTIGQTHILTSTGIASTPVVGQPTIGQEHALSATGISTTSTVGTPTIGQEHALDGTGITSNPVVGQPSIGQTHVLTATGISTTPVVGNPIVGTEGTDDLTATGISTTSTVGTPTIGQTHVLTATGISTTSTVGTPTIGQTHVLNATGISTTPVVGNPFVGGGDTDDLTANGISITPVVGLPDIGQIHALTVLFHGFVQNVAVSGRPLMSQIHNLGAVDTTIVSIVGVPSVGQIHVLTATGIVTMPVVGHPSFSPVEGIVYVEFEAIYPEIEFGAIYPEIEFGAIYPEIEFSIVWEE